MDVQKQDIDDKEQKERVRPIPLADRRRVVAQPVKTDAPVFRDWASI